VSAVFEIRIRSGKAGNWWWGVYRDGKIVRRSAPDASTPSMSYAGRAQEALDALRSARSAHDAEEAAQAAQAAEEPS